MSTIYVFIKPIGAKELFSAALSSDSPEELLKFSAPMEKMFTELREWVGLQSGGRYLSSFGYHFAFEMPLDKVGELSKFMHKFELSAKTPLAIGIGMTVQQAFRAVGKSERSDGSKVVLYSEDLEFEKAEGEAEGGGESDMFPNLDLEEVETLEQQAEQEDPKEDDEKEKITQALLLIRDKAPIISQLKQVDAQAYNAVKKLVEAFITIAKTHMHKGEEDVEETSSPDTNEEETSSPETSESSKSPEGELDKTYYPWEIVDGKIKVEARDEVSREKTGEHWHKVTGGMAMGATGHPVSAHKPNTK